MPDDIPTISVVLCTYNGEAFLEIQLQSILTQTSSPQQLILCDDCSSDRTVELAQHLVEGNEIDCQIIVNDKNLGSSANFNKAIGLCECELIVLADQDDVWRADKLQVIREAFKSRTELGMIFSNGLVIDEADVELKYDLWSSSMFSQSKQAEVKAGNLMNVLLRHNVVTGATMAFRKSLLPLVLPIQDEWVHDEWISLLAAATCETDYIHKPLVRYRRHINQQIGAGKKTIRWQLEAARKFDLQYYHKQLRRFEGLNHRLQSWDGSVRDGVLQKIEGKIAYLQQRISMRQPHGWRWLKSTQLLCNGSHHRYELGVKSWFLDLLYGITTVRLEVE